MYTSSLTPRAVFVPFRSVCFACVCFALLSCRVHIPQSTFVSRSWVGSAIETMVLGGCCAGLAYEIGAAVASCVSGMA